MEEKKKKPIKKKAASKALIEKKNNNEDVPKKLSRKERHERRRTRKGWIIFGIITAIYAVILIIVSMRFLNYVDESLKEYEASQSVYYMEKYFDDFTANLFAGNLPKGVDLSKYVNEFDTYEEMKTKYFDRIRRKVFSFEKASDSYLTEEPVYVIKADQDEIYRVKLQGETGKTLLGILTIMDWKVAEEKPTEYSYETQDYTVTVPESYTVYVDGKPLSTDYLTGKRYTEELFKYASKYTSLPERVEYKINGVIDDLSITVRDDKGLEQICQVEGNNYSLDYERSDTVPQDKAELALNIAQTWSLFMTRDLSGDSHGLGKVSPFLIKDSDYDVLAKNWAWGHDIQFTSDHTLTDPIFRDIIIDNFVSYTDNCFSCHISFNKDMILTLTQATVVDSTDSTFVFVYYDDTEDGVDNPHWCMVDMIANTN